MVASFFLNGSRNEWTHVVITYDAATTTLRIYFNGEDPEVITPFAPPVDLSGGSDYFNLGVRSGGGNYYNGYIDIFIKIEH